MNMPKRNELEDIEIQLLLSGVFHYYGFDFRNYAPASLKRRIWNIIRSEQLTSIRTTGEGTARPACLERFLLGLSVNVTAMFRDPSFYLSHSEAKLCRYCEPIPIFGSGMRMFNRGSLPWRSCSKKKGFTTAVGSTPPI